ncbi:copper-resistance protein, CopA family [Arachidicoccus rhizosphaerae]|uniref:Copper-resistance protein, CopA family n=1 Tax=Arachidicoccus rhizosphaerae TaxID=551991 RepID=A0A1H3WUF6_9BACT|nr:multicopper oxidase domain-containing protein [Arachidicoccus rhizosphaerae]SDZ90807.1 copper-resistance protein, CopA family [Arachidicoccus rhizosphaerae]
MNIFSRYLPGLLLGLLLFYLQPAAAQEKPKFDHGNNDRFTPFASFAVPVAHPTLPGQEPPLGVLSNMEKDIATKPVEAAGAGIHFAPGEIKAKTVRYDLFITDSTVGFDGKSKRAIAVNGQLPAPTLVFTIGDTALIYVHNNSDEPTAVHWHGVQLANRMDGVAYLTQHPIAPHTTYIYKFPVVQAGTYWYHSHYALQEQVGLYGALIFNKRTEPEIPTIPVVLSDWSNMKPEEIDRRLHTASDWFSIKKKAVQSYSEAIAAGKVGVKLLNEWKRMKAMDVSDVYYERFLLNGHDSSKVKGLKPGDKVRLRVVNGSASTYFWLKYSGSQLMVVASDGNDVKPVMVDNMIIGPSETYDLVVSISGNNSFEFLATAEDRTGSASLWLGDGPQLAARPPGKLKYFAGMAMMNDMMKTSGKMDDMGMAMSLQTMDMNSVMYPELDGASEQDRDMAMPDSTSMEQNMNHGKWYTCPMHPDIRQDKPGKCPKCGMELELVKSEGKDASMSHLSGHKTAEKDRVAEVANMESHAPVTLNYNMLEATHKTTLPDGLWRTLNFELTGNMNRYVWTINNKTVSETDKILIKKGENLRIVLYNNSMMRHPMHLHGHDFRLVNQYADSSPMKNVVDIMPMETDTLEFNASESGDWFFHCHILYHMMSGMGRIFTYQDSPHNPEMPHPDMGYKMLKMDDRMFHLKAENDFATNGNDGSLVYANTRWAFQGEWRLGYNNKDGYEVETHFGRYLGSMQWLFPYVGIDWRHRRHKYEEKSLFGQTNTKDDRKVFHVGIQYTLPWLVVADASVDHNGYVRMQLSREDIPLTPRLRANFMVNSDREYSFGGKYILTKLFSLSTHYDSDMGWGAGITLTY